MPTAAAPTGTRRSSASRAARYWALGGRAAGAWRTAAAGAANPDGDARPGPRHAAKAIGARIARDAVAGPVPETLPNARPDACLDAHPGVGDAIRPGRPSDEPFPFDRAARLVGRSTDFRRGASASPAACSSGSTPRATASRT